MDPVTALLVISAGAKVGEGVAQIGAADQKLEALELMKEQHVLQHQQKTLANFETTQKILDSQIAEATTRGVGLGSQSLEAIRRNTMNTESKRQSNLDIEESLFERNIGIEKSNVRSTLFAELFGDAASFGADLAGVEAKRPRAA